jgi:hypothetical protein
LVGQGGIKQKKRGLWNQSASYEEEIRTVSPPFDPPKAAFNVCKHTTGGQPLWSG